MQNKTALITGATNGLGKAMAQDLAQMGAKIVIVSRNEEKCATTVKDLQQKTGNTDIHYYAADLSIQSEVRNLVQNLNHDLPRLDVLINNAGAWFTKRTLNVDGIEMTWALNHLSYFLLTHGLLDLLKQTSQKYGEARIINQASSAHHEGIMHWNNLQFEGKWRTDGKGSSGPGWGAYSQSKLANVLHAFALARQLEGSGVVANAIHPSVVVTGLSQNNGIVYKIAAPVRRIFNRTSAHHGAAPAVYLASAPEAAAISGAYFGPPQKREEASPTATEVDMQDRLWEISMAQVGLSTCR